MQAHICDLGKGGMEVLRVPSPHDSRGSNLPEHKGVVLREGPWHILASFLFIFQTYSGSTLAYQRLPMPTGLTQTWSRPTGIFSMPRMCPLGPRVGPKGQEWSFGA